MIARSCFQFSVLTLLFASLLACSYETRHVQSALAVRPTNKDEATLLRATVKKFSHAEGFLTKRQAGNEEHLEKSGRYLLTFAAADKSFISISNIVNMDCYDIGLHSAVNEARSKGVGRTAEARLALNCFGRNRTGGELQVVIINRQRPLRGGNLKAPTCRRIQTEGAGQKPTARVQNNRVTCISNLGSG